MGVPSPLARPAHPCLPPRRRGIRGDLRAGRQVLRVDGWWACRGGRL